MNEFDVVVVGAGIGGLCSSILLGAAGLRVLVVEKAEGLGGKAGTVILDGVEVDTGPSVLTLPHVFDEVFAAAGMRRQDEVKLTTPSPGFRYLYHDGTSLDVFGTRSETITSVRDNLGTQAGRELEHYLSYAERIWDAAAPHFVYSGAPDVSGLLFGGPAKWKAVTKIDPFRTLAVAIDDMVKSPHLKMLLRRYATYNGSDARKAPATLGCIAHVELALGGHGVLGGMVELVRALERAALRVGVDFLFQAPVARIRADSRGTQGVELADGKLIKAGQVVANADVAHLAEDLLEDAPGLHPPRTPSMSAHTGVIRARRLSAPRPAHTVLFPQNYENEFRDIFDLQRVPLDPTIYLCAQESCHQRSGWDAHEPVFCMVNSPALDDFSGQESADEVRCRILGKLRNHQLISNDDSAAWWRTPADLAARFPGSRGSLYGAASNTMNAAFQRPPNRARGLPGLYLASGSAHPGGGVPMVALSAKQAARAVLKDRKAVA